jgi:RimJ/RimL family protein N-acetyltransferase
MVAFVLMPVRLRSDVALGELTASSAVRMFSWMLDPEISEAIGLSQEPSLERTIAWIERAQRNETILARRILHDDLHVGNVVFDQLDGKVGAARLSIYIGERAARGKGIGKTAIYLALAHVFHERQLYRVWLTVHSENAVAIRAYRELGFQVEGNMRGAFVLNGRRVDGLYMALLTTEFSKLAVQPPPLSR